MGDVFRPDQAMLETAQKALERGLCLHCLGRLFGKVGSGYTNTERGRMLEELLDGQKAVPVSECFLCEGLFDEIEDFVALVKAAADDMEFDTFLVGSKVDLEVAEREERLWEELGVVAQEPIKSELNREIGKRAERLMERRADLTDPHLSFVVDTRYNNIELTVRPVYVYGRYRKLERGIPQTKWFCRKCRGHGCTHCGGTGKMYPTSVEELVGAPALAAAGGTSHSFHGMGREDIDARMLGNGRPFVLEIEAPKKRSLDLKALEEEINRTARDKVEVEGLKFSDLATVRSIKASKSRKTYRAKIEFEVEPDREKVYKVANNFRNSLIQQQTPNRVSHRRADKNRRRAVHEFQVLELDGPLATVEITGDSGLYIKELLHGDQGRTKPNFAEEVGAACKVLSLDVVRIWDDAEEA